MQEMKDLAGSRIFITGGTGFFGRWFLKSILDARRDGAKIDAVVLTRKPQAIALEYPEIEFWQGDVRDFKFPDGQFSHVIHAATAAAAASGADAETHETIVGGTRRTLEFAERAGVSRFLFVSSGAVYGPQPSEVTHVPEDYEGTPNTAYGIGKKEAEKVCFASKLETVSARCFALAGPYMPFTGPFALGNFIWDAVAGGPIRVNGDGTPYRSYLYAGDLMEWLWTMLARGQSGRAYNVGSEIDAPIREFAERVGRCFTPEIRVEVARAAVAGAAPARYVPSTRRAQEELGLRETVGFEDAVQRTLKWIRTGTV